MKQLYIALIAGLLSTAAMAAPVTINFDDLTYSGTGWTSIENNVAQGDSTYTSNGYVLTTLGGVAGGTGFGSAHTGQTDYYFGQTSLFNDNTNGGVTTLTQVGGAAFSLVSMEVATLTNDWTFYSNEYVTFTGTLANGGTVTQSVLLLNDTSFQTVDFVGFGDVTSVSWAQGSAADPDFNQFTDIVLDSAVDSSGSTSVPEPGSIALLGLGLAALVAKRRKSKSV